ncbi:MAG: glycosyltransferase family 2 protein [Armatimonadetes bacterium]|nr:glycosyltransferase family 2 protein [Armatimonadota bacterium]
MRVSVIIVSYNTSDLLRQGLQALASEDVHEVIVVDNASKDGSPEMIESDFPNVKLIRNNKNRGFGAANNQGMDAMTGDVALLLNSDARPKPGAIAKLAQVMEDESVIACGGKLLFPDGRIQESACNPLTLWAVFCEQTWLEKIFPNSKLFSPYWISSRLAAQGNGPHEVAQVMGACLMLRPVERFNEQFFLYCEDTELCHRLAKHGKIMYAPEAEFVHELGASSTATRWESIARYNRGKELYFQLHHGEWPRRWCLFWNRMGAKKRMEIWGLATILTLGLVKRFRSKAAMFAKVLFCPKAGPPLPPDAR